MAQRRIGLGLALLLATVVIPLIEWFTLAAIRTNKFLDDHGAPKVTMFNKTDVSKPASVSNARLFESGARSASTAENAEQELRDHVLSEPLSNLHAWEIQIENCESRRKSSSHPRILSRRQRYCSYRIKGNSPMISIYDLRTHELRKTIQPTELPTVFAWSPDGNRLAYRAGQGIHS